MSAPVTLWRMPNGDYADPRRIAMPRGEAVVASDFRATEHRALPAAEFDAIVSTLESLVGQYAPEGYILVVSGSAPLWAAARAALAALARGGA